MSSFFICCINFITSQPEDRAKIKQIVVVRLDPYCELEEEDVVASTGDDASPLLGNGDGTTIRI